MKSSKIALSLVLLLSSNIAVADTWTWLIPHNSSWSNPNWTTTSTSTTPVGANAVLVFMDGGSPGLSPSTYDTSVSNLSVKSMNITAGAEAVREGGYIIQGLNSGLPIPFSGATGSADGIIVHIGLASVKLNFLQANGVLNIQNLNPDRNNATQISSISGTGDIHLDGINGTAPGPGPGTLSQIMLLGSNSYVGSTYIGSANPVMVSCSAPNVVSSGGFSLGANSLFDLRGNSQSFPTGSFITSSSSSITNLASTSVTLSIAGAVSDTQTISGTIYNAIGSLALAKSGASTLLLSGSNSYTGGTTVSGGTLQIATQANIANGTLTLAGGTLVTTGAFAPTATVTASANTSSTITTAVSSTIANLTGQAGASLSLGGIGVNSLGTVDVASGTFTVNGTTSGTQLNKTGSGTLSLLNGNTYTGGTTVTGGQLAVLGSLSSPLTVSPSAVLSGTGTITGAVVNQGNLSPGASIGTLTVNGNYTQDAGSTYTNEINATQTDLLAINGSLIINGTPTLTIVPLSPGPFANSYTLITYTGAAPVGRFNLVTPLLIPGTLSYPAGSVVLNVTSVPSVKTFVSTGNAGHVAGALDTIFASGAFLSGIYGDLLAITSQTELTAALNQMQSSMFKGAVIAQENNAFQVREALSERIQVVLDAKDCNKELEVDRKVHFWMTGVGDFLHQSSVMYADSPQVGYQDNTGGFVTGVDYNFLTNFYLGALGAYTHSDVNWQQSQGQGDIDSGYAGVYLSAIGKLFYGNLSVIGAWSSYDEHRNIIYSDVNQTASNDHHGEQLITHVDTGLNFGYKSFSIRPFDSLDWIVQNESDFTENGAGEYNLSVSKSHANMLRNELGVNLASSLCVGSNKAIFDAKLGWVREVRMSGKYTDAEFVGTDVPFTVTGYFPNRNLFSVGASVTAVALKDRLTCTVYYNGAFGKGYSDNGIGGQLNLGF